MKKRIAVVLVALVLSISCIVGTTLAWLTDTTNEVKNTFTYGDINIELNESDSDDTDTDTRNNSYKMVPGNTIAKDPYVYVEKNSEASWIFVKIVEGGSITIGETTYTFDDFLSYTIDSAWTVASGVVDTNDSNNGNETIIIYREADATTTNNSANMPILANNAVTVNTTVTKEMMNAIDGLTYNTDGTITENSAELANRPTLTFTAYAVQKANVSMSEAYKIAFGTDLPTNS